MRLLPWLLGPLFVLCGMCRAEDAAQASVPPDFIRDIQPLFAARCQECHGADAQESDFRLDVRSAALRGGLSGKAIVPGNAAASRLIEYVTADPDSGETAMPPEGERLTAAEIELLRSWIDAGATWPDEAANESALDNDVDNPARWAFRPPVKPEPPAVQDAAWPRGAIDRFVLARLEAVGLARSPEADRRTLMRRLSFDLTGLPPSPEEVAAFVADETPDAYEQLVERLLASPRYGERWARHWLDAVRFAESHGFEMNQPRPNAWPYRDYVIAAFNDDLPYDRFVMEQLAGDALGADAATGFLVGGAWDQVKSPDPALTAQQRMDELHDIGSTTAGVFLGLTVGCARCHNHKFDPISQRDYYALQALLAGVEHGERALPLDPSAGREERLAALAAERQALDTSLERFVPLADPRFVAGAGQEPPRPPVHPLKNFERFAPVTARFVRFTVLATNGSEPCLDELEVFTAGDRRNLALAAAGARATASSVLPGVDIHQLAHVHDGRYGNGRSWISNEPGRGWVVIELAEDAVIDTIVWGRDREGAYADRTPVEYQIEVALAPDAWQVVATSADRRPFVAGASSESLHSAAGLAPEAAAELDALLARAAEIDAETASLSSTRTIYAGRFQQPGATHLLHRGEALQPREEISPAGIAAIEPALALSADAPERERRLALARWIVDERNPLTARVLVNRVWQHHFGQGLVATPSDFGANGGRPTHPELLDWLAVEFMQRGWSVKALHRSILLSATYRQASALRAEGLAQDAAAQLLWRFPPRRLEAEPIRDAVLAVSGVLDLSMGGPGYEVFEPNENYVRVFVPKQEFGPAEWRRMIYQRKPRMEQDEVFGAFDCPDAGQAAPRRNTSTTPLQALNLLNSRFQMRQSELFAERLRRESGADPAQQARRAFRLAFQRPAAEDELAAVVALVERHGLAAFCRAMFNANEFVYLE